MKGFVFLFLALIFLGSCRPIVPAVPSNGNQYFYVQDQINTSPRYLNGINLFIIYKEHYNDKDSKLDYKIFDQKRRVVQSSSTVQVSIRYGVNKLKIPLTGLSTNSGIYVLEITDEKDQKKYITFLKSV